MAHRSTLLVLAFPALLAIAAWLLWPGISGPFLFDDAPNLENLREINGKLDRHSIGVYLSLFGGTPGRPLSALSFLLNDFAWPAQPLGFKLTNLWIHLLNGVLVFGLSRSLARACTNTSDRAALIRADIAALIAAAIWLLNPIQISAIFLTVQRMAQLAGTFMFAGLWAYTALGLRARTAWQAFLALSILGVATVLALLSKENGILTPMLALVLNATLLRAPLSRMPLAPARVLRYGIIATVGLLVLVFAYQWTSLTSFTSRDYTMWERLMSQARALLDYVGMILIPRLSSSSLYHDFAVSRGLLNPITTLPAIVIVLAALAAALVLRRRMPLAAFAVLWFLTAHALESTAFPLELYFEHRNYVPLFGPAFAIAIAILRVRGKLQRPALAGLAIWLLLCAAILNLQARTWGDYATLSTYWHLENPGSLRAQQQYAQYLLATGQAAEAGAALGKAIEQDVSPVDTRLQSLVVACARGDDANPAEVAAVGKLLATQQLIPGTAMVLQRLRHSVEAGDCPALVSAGDWLHLTQLALDNPKGKNLFRMLLMERAELFLAADELDAAIREMELAYGHDGEPRIAFYAAALLATAERYDEARAWAERPLGRPWTWKRWLAQTDQQARLLIDTIDQSQKEASAEGSRPLESTPPPPDSTSE